MKRTGDFSFSVLRVGVVRCLYDLREGNGSFCVDIGVFF